MCKNISVPNWLLVQKRVSAKESSCDFVPRANLKATHLNFN